MRLIQGLSAATSCMDLDTLDSEPGRNANLYPKHVLKNQAAEDLVHAIQEVCRGNVNVGTTGSSNVTLTNNGNSSVTISSVTATGAGFNASGVSAGTTLTPGQTATLNVTFAPTTAGSVTGSVTVASNATNSPTTITLSGTGVSASAPSVALTWDASMSAGMVGYNVYRATPPSTTYTKLVSSPVSGLKYMDQTLAAGTTYNYVVTAVNSSGEESAYSVPAIVVLP